MKQSNIKGTAVYLRLNSPCQLGIWTQETRVNNYLSEVGDAENVSYFLDNGYSGSTAERPALQAMLEQIAQGTIDKIVIASISRLARNYVLMGELVTFFKAHGVELISLAEGADSNSIMELLEVLP